MRKNAIIKILLTFVFCTLALSILYFLNKPDRHSAQKGVLKNRESSSVSNDLPDDPTTDLEAWTDSDAAPKIIKNEKYEHFAEAANDFKATAGAISFEQKLEEMDDEALRAIAMGPGIGDMNKHMAFSTLLTRLGEMEDNEYVIEAILEIVGQLQGEDLQSALKILGSRSGVSANNVIVEAFSHAFFEEDASNLSRMLSYISPTQPLSDWAADELKLLYDRSTDRNISISIVRALAANTSHATTEWIIAQVESSEDSTEQIEIISALRSSESYDLLVYLNECLNKMVNDNNTSREVKEQLRQTILAINKNWES